MSILNALLGQPDTSVPTPVQTPDITAGLGGFANDPAQGLNTTPQPLTGDAAARPFSHYEVTKKHGLSELLSIAGDMALASTGLQPQYLPSLQRAKEADALTGFQDDPVGAINRLTEVNPDKALSVYNDFVTDTYHKALTNSSVASAQAAAQKAVQDTDLYKQKVFGAATSLLNTATQPGFDPKTYPALAARTRQFLVARGAGDMAEMVPQTYDVGNIQRFANSSVPVDKQVDNARQEAAFEETKRHNTVDEGISAENAGTAAANSSNQSDNIDSEISDRLWRQQHGDKGDVRKDANNDSLIAHRQWLEAHPSKQRQGAAPDAIKPGFKNQNGLTYQGGDINNRANWKRL